MKILKCQIVENCSKPAKFAIIQIRQGKPYYCLYSSARKATKDFVRACKKNRKLALESAAKGEPYPETNFLLKEILPTDEFVE